jgi:succinate dehydrogenase / fumarate reductase membrane anchor subunit
MTHDRILSPLARARGTGSARSGVHHWWVQRVTAVALIPLTLYFLFCLPALTTPDLAAFRAFIGAPLNGVAALLFVGISFYHAVLGVQVVIEDYIHGEAMKIAALMLNKIVFLFLGVACIYAIFLLNFG